MTVLRVPATPPATTTHWIVGNHPDRRNACGAPSGSSPANTSSYLTTCPDCLTTVVRTLCMTPTPGDIVGVGAVCRQKLGPDGTHAGLHDWENPAATKLTEQERDRALALDSPSGMLPRRTPGAALGDVEGESEPGVRPGCERGSDRVLER